MTIKSFQKLSTVRQEAFNTAHDLVIRSGADVQLELHAQAAREAARGGRPRTLPGYPAAAILTGLLLLGMHARPMTIANLLRLLWDELSDPMLATLGLQELINPHSKAQLNSKRAYRSQYERVRKAVDRLIEPVNPSPHPRQVKEDNKALRDRMHKLTTADRERLTHRRTLLLNVCNSIVRASLPERPADHDGSIALDGVIIEANAGLAGTGTANGLPHGADPDAGWWTLKQKQDRRIWGYCLTLAIASHMLYGRKVPNVCTGLSIAKANGGDRDEALEALDATIANGWGPRDAKHPPVLIVDRGYSNKNGLAAAALARGYDQAIDYSKVSTGLKDTNGKLIFANPDPIQHTFPQGPMLYNGVPVCPGAMPLIQPPVDTTTGVVEFHPGGRYDARTGHVDLRHPGEPDPGKAHAILAHRHLQKILLAHQMPINQRLRFQQNGGRPGRPSTTNPVRPTHSLQVICPAAACQVRCPLFAASMLLKPGTVPDVHTPPAPDANGNLPLCCSASTYVTLQLQDREVKLYQKHMHGNDDWADRYGGSRSRNEQYNSQLKDRNATGLDDDAFEVTGIARVALILALAVAVTNLNQAAAYNNTLRDGRPALEDRHTQKLQRKAIAAAARNRARGKGNTDTN